MSWKERAKYIIQLFSLYWTLGISVQLFLIWFCAWLCGGSVMVYINKFGEACPELLLWFITIPVVIYGFYLNHKRVF